MGFADMIAQAGRGTAVGRVGELFGGQTDDNRQEAQLQSFIANELPRYAAAIEAETDERKIGRIGYEFMSNAAKSGMPLAAIEKVMGMLVEPAKQNLRRQTAGTEYGQMADELTPRMEGRPEGVEGPVNASGAFLERPGRRYHQGDAMRLGGIEARTGVKPPAGLAGLLQAPSVVEENEGQAAAANALAGRHKTEESLNRVQEETLRGLPDTDIGGTGISPRSLGLGTQGRGLTGLRRLMPEEQDPLIEDRRGLIRAQTNAANRRNQPGEGGAGGSVTETVTERNVDPMRQLEAERVIAKTAIDRGIMKLPPEQRTAALQQLAADMGYELEGTPEIDDGGGLNIGLTRLGQGPAKLGGAFSLKPKPTTRTSTRGRGGNQPGGKTLDNATAAQIFEKAGRDPKKAAAMAKQMGYKVD